jgi:hypothetical protein
MMSDDWTGPGGDGPGGDGSGDGGRDIVSRAFDALSALDGLRQAMAAARPRRPSPSALYAFATDPDVALDDGVLLDARCRADLEVLLARTAAGRLPRVAAASSGEIHHRRGDGFTVRVVPSRSTAGQVYVLVEVPAGLPMPQALFVLPADAAPIQVALPVSGSGRAQLLAERASPLVAALGAVSTEVFVR